MFLIFSLLSLVGTSVKYLFPLVSSKYPFIFLRIRYKEFSLLVFMYSQSLIVTYTVHKDIILHDFLYILILFESNFFYIDNTIKKVVCMVFYIYMFDFITHFNLYYLFRRLLNTINNSSFDQLSVSLVHS